jgi:hypothetical protein
VRKSDMSAAQLVVRQELTRLLQNAGWDLGGWQTLFEADNVTLDPELQAEFSHDRTRETFGWSAERDEISLRIQDVDTPAHLFRLPSRDKEVSLAKVLVANQNEITSLSFGSAIRSLTDIAGVVYWESSMGTIELKPEGPDQAEG